ncbi:MAG: hypothetical protein R2795_25565 [Saprospiraceae bacterium]
MARFHAMLYVLFMGNILLAQHPSLVNPGFEGSPNHSTVPEGWIDCGFPGESAPDVHPDNIFGVRTRPFEGNTYLGLVGRDNHTWERVGASLSDPLQKGGCYTFSIALCRAQEYLSTSRVTYNELSYTAPVYFRLWGCEKSGVAKELLGKTGLINHTDWRKYEFLLQPLEGTYGHILLEVGFATKVAVNGNLLLDAASDFVPLADCELSEDRQLIALSLEEKETPISLPAVVSG